MILLGKYLMK